MCLTNLSAAYSAAGAVPGIVLPARKRKMMTVRYLMLLF